MVQNNFAFDIDDWRCAWVIVNKGPNAENLITNELILVRYRRRTQLRLSSTLDSSEDLWLRWINGRIEVIHVDGEPVGYYDRSVDQTRALLSHNGNADSLRRPKFLVLLLWLGLLISFDFNSLLRKRILYERKYAAELGILIISAAQHHDSVSRSDLTTIDASPTALRSNIPTDNECATRMCLNEMYLGVWSWSELH